MSDYLEVPKRKSDMISFDIAEREGGEIYNHFLALDDLLCEIEVGTDEGSVHLLDLEPEQEINRIFQRLAYHSVNIWMYAKPPTKSLKLLDLLSNDLYSFALTLPMDGDYFVSFNLKMTSNLREIFDLMQLTEYNGKIYNLSDRNTENMRANFLYLIDCMIHFIRQRIELEYLKGNIKIVK